MEVGAIEHDHVVDFAGGRWSGNVDSPALCGAAVKRAGAAGKLLRVSVLKEAPQEHSELGVAGDVFTLHSE